MKRLITLLPLLPLLSLVSLSTVTAGEFKLESGIAIRPPRPLAVATSKVYRIDGKPGPVDTNDVERMAKLFAGTAVYKDPKEVLPDFTDTSALEPAAETLVAVNQPESETVPIGTHKGEPAAPVQIDNTDLVDPSELPSVLRPTSSHPLMAREFDRSPEAVAERKAKAEAARARRVLAARTNEVHKRVVKASSATVNTNKTRKAALEIAKEAGAQIEYVLTPVSLVQATPEERLVMWQNLQRDRDFALTNSPPGGIQPPVIERAIVRMRDTGPKVRKQYVSGGYVYSEMSDGTVVTNILTKSFTTRIELSPEQQLIKEAKELAIVAGADEKSAGDQAFVLRGLKEDARRAKEEPITPPKDGGGIGIGEIVGGLGAAAAAGAAAGAAGSRAFARKEEDTEEEKV